CDQDQVAVAEAASGSSHFLGSRRIEVEDQLAQRDARHDRIDDVLGRVTVRPHDDALDASFRVLQRSAALVEVYRDPVLLRRRREALPHLTGAEAGIAELFDQSRDVLAPKSDNVEYGLAEREVLDP